MPFIEQIKALVGGLSPRQGLLAAAAAIAVIAGLTGLVRWNKERGFKPLYTNLPAEDAGAVVAKLRESGVEYRVDGNGSAVLVPEAKVAELRLTMAAAGIPKTGRIGFEVFDRTNFGGSDFAEQVNYHRALEGELERSVATLSEVEQARVHLTFPKESLFAESRQPAKASVLLRLRLGSKLSAQNVQAVEHLVASAVEGLTPEGVSVLDMRGNLLSRPRPRGLPDSGEPDEAGLDYRQRIERDLLNKIHLTLEPVVGAEKYRASVAVECDFSSGEQSEETWDPTKSVMATSQRTEDIAGANMASGVPGTASNLPRPTSRPGGTAGGVTRRTENISYQSSRVLRRMKLPQGAVKRVSVGLVLDHVVRWEGTGDKARRVLVPPGEEQLKVIRELVSGAAGLQPERGDRLIVESLPFAATLALEPPGQPGAPPAPGGPGLPLPLWLARLLQAKDGKVDMRLVAVAAGAAVGLLLLLLAAVFMLVRRRRGKRKAALVVETPRAIEGGGKDLVKSPSEAAKDFEDQMHAKFAEQEASRQREEMEALRALKLAPAPTKKSEVLSKHIGEEAKKRPDVTAQLMRTWISEGER